MEHRPSTNPSPSYSVLGCSGHFGPVGTLVFELCFSVLPPTVARPASLPLPLRVPCKGLACDAGCWLPEGVSDPAPLSPQYLPGHWFLSCSLPPIFILDLRGTTLRQKARIQLAIFPNHSILTPDQPVPAQTLYRLGIGRRDTGVPSFVRDMT